MLKVLNIWEQVLTGPVEATEPAWRDDEPDKPRQQRRAESGVWNAADSRQTGAASKKSDWRMDL